MVDIDLRVMKKRDKLSNNLLSSRLAVPSLVHLSSFCDSQEHGLRLRAI